MQSSVPREAEALWDACGGPPVSLLARDRCVLKMLQPVALICATEHTPRTLLSVRRRTDRNMPSLLNDAGFSMQVERALLSGQGCRLIENGSSNRVR